MLLDYGRNVLTMRSVFSTTLRILTQSDRIRTGHLAHLLTSVFCLPGPETEEFYQ